MAYLALARKYRPKSFSEMLGQEHVVTTLRHALDLGKISHAYIFSGPRGTGKTTVARILAMCLNCENSKTTTSEPCGKCGSCQDITSGTSNGDVLEIDGASNRGIEEIREIRENVKYVPSTSRYKVYIIDEAHQITKDGFNALLKTLEEPPAHAVFMMATTEPYRMPTTILSRCQRFQLVPIPGASVTSHLESIAKKEGINADRTALEILAKSVHGSLRDALSLLDQASVHSPEGITANTIRNLLGLMPQDMVENIAAVIKTGDPAKILNVTDNVRTSGYEWSQIARELQHYFHELMLTKAGVGTTEDAAKAGEYSWNTLVRNVRLLGRCLDEMRRSDTPRTLFEITCVQLGQAVTDITSIVKKLDEYSKDRRQETGDRSQEPEVGSQKSENREQRTENREQKSEGTNQNKDNAEQNEEDRSQDTKDSKTEGGAQNNWAEMMAGLQQERPSLASALLTAKIEFALPDKIILRFSSSFPMERVKKSLPEIIETYNKRCGCNANIECVLVKDTPDAGIPNNADTPNNDDSSMDNEDYMNDPGVKKVMSHFPGRTHR